MMSRSRPFQPTHLRRFPPRNSPPTTPCVHSSTCTLSFNKSLPATASSVTASNYQLCSLASHHRIDRWLSTSSHTQQRQLHRHPDLFHQIFCLFLQALCLFHQTSCLFHRAIYLFHVVHTPVPPVHSPVLTSVPTTTAIGYSHMTSQLPSPSSLELGPSWSWGGASVQTYPLPGPRPGPRARRGHATKARSPAPN